MTGEEVGEMVADMLQRQMVFVTKLLLSGDQEATDRYLDAEHAAMVEDYERDFE